MRKSVESSQAPLPVGAYSQAVWGGSTLYISGQLPLDPVSKELVKEITQATHLALENLRHILKGASLSMDDVVAVNIYLANMDHFAAVNEVYAKYFSPPYPARAMVEVSGLPKGAPLEIQAEAFRSG